MRNQPARVRIAGLALSLFLTACGSVPVPPPEAVGAALVWPQPPAEPRIRYVRAISGPHDLGIVKSFFQRIVETFTGEQEEYFIRPTGVAELQGVLYVADPGAQAVWILDLMQRRFAEVRRMGKTEFVSPVAVAVRGDGSVFVADSGLKRIFLLDRDGKLLQTIGENELMRPAALAYDQERARLYVADSVAHRIVVYQGGKRVLTWGKRGGADGEFNFPTHLFLDRSGNLFVTDALNYRIQAFDRTGKFLWKIGQQGDGSGSFAAPKGAALDIQGHLYVVDALFDAVQIFNRRGQLLLGFGKRGTRPGEFWLPEGIFINSRDRIYVADSFNQRVQVFDFIASPEPGT